MKQLETRASDLITRSIADSTRRQYQSYVTTFLNWCRNVNLVAFPLHEHNLVLYVSHLSVSASYSSVKVNIAALKFYALANGNEFSDFKRLYLVMRGIRRSQGRRFSKQKRLPITPQVLLKIKRSLFNSSVVYNDKLMLWAAMLTAFFGFLRVSEYASPSSTSSDPQATLYYRDALTSPDNNTITIRIKVSKTDPFRAGTDIKLVRNGSELCPVSAMQKFLVARGQKAGPLFVFANGKYLTRYYISNAMKRFSGITANLSSHSFRIGAATTLASQGYPRWLIQSLGRWTSDCFRDYIRIPEATIAQASSALTRETENSVAFDPDVVRA